MDLFFILVTFVTAFGLSIVNDPLTRKMLDDWDD
jgi:hypothetical protein